MWVGRKDRIPDGYVFAGNFSETGIWTAANVKTHLPSLPSSITPKKKIVKVQSGESNPDPLRATLNKKRLASRVPYTTAELDAWTAVCIHTELSIKMQ
jgi:hypothetical protein